MLPLCCGDELGAGFRLKRGESVFCDVGCGTGRPSLYAAGLELRASLGFDVDPLQVMSSNAGLQAALKSGVELRCPIGFVHADAWTMKTLDPTTHAYAFVGCPGLVRRIAVLAARSVMLKVVALVVLREDELVESGLLASGKDDPDVIRFAKSMKMGGGTGYRGLVIPISEERRLRIRAKLAELPQRDIADADLEDNLATRDLEATLVKCSTDQGRVDLIREGIEAVTKARPPRRAAASRSSLLRIVAKAV